MTIKQHGGIFGRNPTFNNVDIEGDLSVSGSISINGEVLSGLDFEGSWDANANSPDLTAITPTTGQFWIVSTAGTTDLGGITNWGVGDWALYDGSAWNRIEGGADGNFVNLDVTTAATFDFLNAGSSYGNPLVYSGSTRAIATDYRLAWNTSDDALYIRHRLGLWPSDPGSDLPEFTMGKGAPDLSYALVKLMPVQTGADSDQLGLQIWVHDSIYGSATVSEAARWRHDGDLDITQDLQGSIWLADSSGIKDGNGNSLLMTTTTTSAVNYIGVANAATGAGPTVSTAGSDSNIDLNITPKGDGKVTVTNINGIKDINAQTGTTYELVAADAGRLVTLNNAGAITLTVPAEATVDYPIGTQIDITALGAGQVTVSSTATLRYTPGAKLRTQYSAGTLTKIASDEWLLVGDLSA